MSQGIQVASGSWERHENKFSLRTFRKEPSPIDSLILAQWDLCQISDPQNFKIKNVYCFKLLKWWAFVLVAVKNQYRSVRSLSRESIIVPWPYAIISCLPQFIYKIQIHLFTKKRKEKKHILCARQHSSNTESLQHNQRSKTVLYTGVHFSLSTHTTLKQEFVFFNYYAIGSHTFTLIHISKTTNTCTSPSLWPACLGWVCFHRLLNGE